MKLRVKLICCQNCVYQFLHIFLSLVGCHLHVALGSSNCGHRLLKIFLFFSICCQCCCLPPCSGDLHTGTDNVAGGGGGVLKLTVQSGFHTEGGALRSPPRMWLARGVLKLTVQSGFHTEGVH